MISLQYFLRELGSPLGKYLHCASINLAPIRRNHISTRSSHLQAQSTTFIIILLGEPFFDIYNVYKRSEFITKWSNKGSTENPPQLLTGREKNEAEKAHNGRGQLKSITRRCSINHCGAPPPSSPPSWAVAFICRYTHLHSHLIVCRRAAGDGKAARIIPNVSQQMGCWWMHYDVRARHKHTQHQMGTQPLLRSEKFTEEASRVETGDCIYMH